jgi:membrane-bound inhibitor of C-type lysozyme
MKNEKGNVIVVVLILVFIGIIAGLLWWNSQQKKANVVSDVSTTINYVCDDQKTIRAEYLTEEVSITLSDNRTMTLYQGVSASGARYTNTDESVVFWEKGEMAFLEENDQETFSNCKELSSLSGEALKENAKNIESLVENYMIAKKSRDLEEAQPYMTTKLLNSLDQEKFAGPSSPQMGRYEIISVDYLVNEEVYEVIVRIYQNLQEKEVGYIDNIYHIVNENESFLISNQQEGEFVETQ